MIERLTNALVVNKTIKEEDKELYSYGLRQGMVMLAQTVSILLAGILLGMWWQSVLFMLAYAPLRLSAGGIHANKQWICFICTLLHFAAVMMLIKHIDWSSFAMIVATALSVAVVLLFAPVEDKNKPFDEVEKRVYTTRTRIILFIEATIILLLLAFQLNSVAECICVTLGTLAAMVAMGSMKNSVNGKSKVLKE